MKIHFLNFLFILLIPLIDTAQAAHPLDPLRSNEAELAVKILKKAGKISSATMFPYLMIKEPPKKEILAFKPGAAFRREVFAVVYDRDQSKTYEATIDLKAKKISEWKEIPGRQPSVMLSEFDAAPPIVRKDPRFKEAMNRRGIKNLDDVMIDVWAYGTPDSPLSEKVRLLRAITYLKGKNKNFYARPIDGLTFIVNMTAKTVEEVIDTEVLPLPPEASDFDAKSIGKMRPALKPLKVVQPQGVNYKINGNEIEWQNWRFRFSMHPREGLVLHMVQYKDKGKWRPILFRGSLSEMMVPYGHNNKHWTYRAAFDEGEYGIGRYSGSLAVGADVPDNSKLFDALFVDDFGKPYITKNAVALYERDGGLLWKHFDMYGKENYSRRAQDLVISFITTISNYDYGLSWVFHQDGSLEMESIMSGIMLAKGSAMVSMSSHDHNANPDTSMAHLVAPNVVAPHHQHFFNFRLDLDVDGEKNNVSELASEALKPSDNPTKNAFKMSETQILSEKKAARDLDLKSQRKWKVWNGQEKNSLGYQTGYILVPGENSVAYLAEDSPLRKRGGFVNHHVWFTQQRDDELYAAGPYPLQRSTADGLPVWMEKDRSLQNEDLVLWYTFGVTHAPRPEEWPVMNAHKVGFKIIPAGFFDRNPALDVPEK